MQHFGFLLQKGTAKSRLPLGNQKRESSHRQSNQGEFWGGGSDKTFLWPEILEGRGGGKCAGQQMLWQEIGNKLELKPTSGQKSFCSLARATGTRPLLVPLPRRAGLHSYALGWEIPPDQR